MIDLPLQPAMNAEIESTPKNPLKKYLFEKVQQDYANWIDSGHNQESTTAGSLQGNITIPIKISQSLPSSFNPAAERKRGYIGNSSERKSSNLTTKKYILSNNKDFVPMVHNSSQMCNEPKKFASGMALKSFDGIFADFDPGNREYDEQVRAKVAEDVTKSEELENRKKIEKVKLLYNISKQKREKKKQEMIELGASCHQEWALVRSRLPEIIQERNDQRPLTSNTKEALDDLNWFDMKMLKIMKENKKILSENLLKKARRTQSSAAGEEVAERSQE